MSDMPVPRSEYTSTPVCQLLSLQTPTTDHPCSLLCTYLPRFLYSHTLTSYRRRLCALLDIREEGRKKVGYTKDGVRCRKKFEGLSLGLSRCKVSHIPRKPEKGPCLQVCNASLQAKKWKEVQMPA